LEVELFQVKREPERTEEFRGATTSSKGYPLHAGVLGEAVVATAGGGPLGSGRVPLGIEVHTAHPDERMDRRRRVDERRLDRAFPFLFHTPSARAQARFVHIAAGAEEEGTYPTKIVKDFLLIHGPRALVAVIVSGEHKVNLVLEEELLDIGSDPNIPVDGFMLVGRIS